MSEVESKNKNQPATWAATIASVTVPDTRAVCVERSAATIVVADDDAEMRTVLCDVLENEGYRVYAAEDGKALAQCLKTGRCPERDVPCDLVISDIRMPGETGLKVLEDLRKRDWATPVILITAFGDRDTHEESRRLGANVILDKPFEIDHLLDIVKRVVPLRP